MFFLVDWRFGVFWVCKERFRLGIVLSLRFIDIL